jgi:hypothetical protein
MSDKQTSEDILQKWEKIQFAYDVWFDTLAPKYRVGETIYVQIKTMLGCIVDDFKSAEILAEDRNRWKARCEAAEAVVNKFAMLPPHRDSTDDGKNVYNVWQQLKQQMTK